MYFLSEEERRYVLRKLLPESRREGVAEELRGWNWHEPPLAPVYKARLGIFEIAGQYCPSGRDVYLRHVMGVRPRPSEAMIQGRVLHDVLARIILTAKQLVYRDGVGSIPALSEMALPEQPYREFAEMPALCEMAGSLWTFEQRRIVVRVQEVLSQQPHIGVDALAALALPVVVEQKLDGRFLGLSSHLSADAVGLAEPIMVDIKFGEPREFHRLATTGYALVMESLYEYPIGLGCIVYPRFREGRWTVEREFHIINDELRQWFIEARDERTRLVDEEIDPGTAECQPNCPFWNYCHVQ